MRYFIILLFASFSHLLVRAQSSARDYYELRIYTTTSSDQGNRLDQYLKDGLLPALHRAGIKNVGVFKPVSDTSSQHPLYVLIPYRSLNDIENIPSKIEKDNKYLSDASDYINSAYNNLPYQRMEKIILKAFPGSPHLQVPQLSSPKKDRVYELRSYEGPTEKLHEAKLKMFNTGGEIGLFKRLGFNAVFYSEVLAGHHMPNLMYMTTFENMQARDSHWKSFNEDPQWVKLKADKQYENTVSHSDISLLHPTDYSDL
jgi:hypothetical protein